MTEDRLWLCFPFSKLRSSRRDLAQQGAVVFLPSHSGMYNLGGRQTELLKIPAVDNQANIQFIEILDIDLDLCLADIRKRLPPNASLIDSVRVPMIVATGTMSCSIRYAASVNNGDRNNLLQLQSDVERCLQAGLTKLDDCDHVPNWRDNFIKPLINHVVLKTSGKSNN